MGRVSVGVRVGVRDRVMGRVEQRARLGDFEGLGH